MQTASPPRGSALAGHLSWLVTLVTFVMLLGGTHPSDARRDRTLLVAAAVVLVLNAPLAVWSLRSLAMAEARGARLRAWALIGVRLAVAASVFVFVHGISHEQRDPWAEHDAWRNCGPTIDRWRSGERPAASCAALHMCANEAPLDGTQMTRLRQMIHLTPGCSEL